MKIDIYNIVGSANHCIYCENQNKDQFECNHCIASNDYYCKPSRFKTNDDFINDYFTLLSEYTKLLNKLGFEFEK